MSDFPRVMVTGHRPQDFTPKQAAFAQEALRRLAKQLLEKHGLEEIISGMALGADTWWADTALELGVPFAAYIPFEVQPLKWSPSDQKHWRDLRAQAVREVVVGDSFSVGFLHGRNDAMIRDSDLAIAVWKPSKLTGGTASCVKKLRAKKQPLVIVDLENFRIIKEL